MMPLLVQRNSITGWYGPDQGSRSVLFTRGPPVLKFTKTKQKWKKTHPARSSGNIAREAFKDAVQYFKKELTKEQFKEIDLQNSHSIEDVHKVVLGAKKIYDDSSSRKKWVQKCLRNFSSQMMYYGAVLDTLAQHHPEYVALAWGTVKFVFVVKTSFMLSLGHLVILIID
jgi:hypothetical protein